MKLQKYEGIIKKWEEQLPGLSYCGYMRMYYRNHRWYGTWFNGTERTFSEKDQASLDLLCQNIAKLWPDGCDWKMSAEVQAFKANINGNKDHHLLENSDDFFHYLLFINLEYGNADYPIRIHTYRKQTGCHQ